MRNRWVMTGLVFLAGCGGGGGSGRTELVPDSPSGQWRDQAGWNNPAGWQDPALTVPVQSNAIRARREQEAANDQKASLAEQQRKADLDRAAVEAERRALEAERTGGLDTTPRIKRDVKDTPRPTTRPG